MLFFTGFTRLSSEVHKANDSNKSSNHNDYLRELVSLVDESEKVLTSDGNLDEFGRLLNQEWKLKKGTGKNVTTEAIDSIYLRGCNAGALGGKLLGAGGGGFFVFYVDPDKKVKVREALSELLYIPFRFENSGTKIIYFSSEE